MDDDFRDRLARFDSARGGQRADARARSPGRNWRSVYACLGGVFGFGGALLLSYANRNYEASEAFAPVLLSLFLWVAVTCIVLIVGVATAIFGKRGGLAFLFGNSGASSSAAWRTL